MPELSKMLVIVGGILILLGAFIAAASKIPGIGRLPGDFLIQKGNFTFYFPVATCVLVSLILTAVFSFFRSR